MSQGTKNTMVLVRVKQNVFNNSGCSSIVNINEGNKNTNFLVHYNNKIRR